MCKLVLKIFFFILSLLVNRESRHHFLRRFTLALAQFHFGDNKWWWWKQPPSILYANEVELTKSIVLYCHIRSPLSSLCDIRNYFFELVQGRQCDAPPPPPLNWIDSNARDKNVMVVFPTASIQQLHCACAFSRLPTLWVSQDKLLRSP